jgi:hypothetical protein
MKQTDQSTSLKDFLGQPNLTFFLLNYKFNEIIVCSYPTYSKTMKAGISEVESVIQENKSQCMYPRMKSINIMKI